ncbi:ATP-dependent DNA helicase [Trichonephila inaurata madagascariensis]|uniref:ATP-dependent DNA helicase n=1 Tax=Trichonephila inaurata madagascariensis TaxID=2747483 RepID=A0A8X6X2U3_9ARAC|nr:ATP-dependent DNA helicase [Trichonephila inaurata madagascariensis]
MRFRFIPTSLWPPPAKSGAPCACSEQWLDFRENFTKQMRHAYEKNGEAGQENSQVKSVEHTRAAEAPDEKRARLQADQARHSLARAAETTKQYQVRLQSQQVHQNASRAAETPKQRQSRLQEDQVRHRVSRAAETPIQHVVRLLGLRKQRNVAITLKWNAQMHDGFMHNPRYDYETNNLLDIGRMSNIGDGKVPEDTSTGLIIMPCGQIVNSPDELLSKVYPNIQQNFKEQDWLSHRAIPASRNDVVQKQLPRQEYAYKSIDCILNDDEAVLYPIEFFNSIQTPDLQAHNLILKVGAPIMLIRNIDAPRLCNGTRLIGKKLMQHVIQATVLTGCAKVNVSVLRMEADFY